MFIAALAGAAWVFDNEDYLNAAKKAMRAVLDRMRAPDGGLLHRFRDGEAAIPAFADDYVFIIMALVRLFEAASDPGYLVTAIELNDYFTENFRDDETGGYYPVSRRAELLPARNLEIYDGALPSCNSVAFDNFLRLAGLTGNDRLEELAAEIARTFLSDVEHSPASYAWYLCAADRALARRRKW